MQSIPFCAALNAGLPNDPFSFLGCEGTIKRSRTHPFYRGARSMYLDIVNPAGLGNGDGLIIGRGIAKNAKPARR
jgi:hypothetical protein